MYESIRNHHRANRVLLNIHGGIILYLFSFVAFADVVDIEQWRQSSNTVTMKDGNTARIVRIESLDTSTRQANAVIDAKDRFGNTRRKNVTLRVAADKFKQYARSCYRSPVQCAASAAIGTAAITAMGWY